jgi:AcrR family transcriptional regulator
MNGSAVGASGGGYARRLMTTPPPRVDGRTARAHRTGEAIVSSLIELILEGDPEPTAQKIADRAGLSVRSVFGHYATLEDLHRAAVEQVTLMVIERLSPIDTAERLEVRVDLLCGQRARINEELGPLLQAADRRRRTSPELARSRRRGRKASNEQLHRIFASELEAFEAGVRRRRVAAIEALLSTSSWGGLRNDAELSVDEARVALRDAILALLRPDPGSPDAPDAPGPTGTSADR